MLYHITTLGPPPSGMRSNAKMAMFASTSSVRD